MKLPNNKPCPRCREAGGDSTGDHLYRVKNTTTGKLTSVYKCRSCDYVEHMNESSGSVTVLPSESRPSVTVTPRLKSSEIESLPVTTFRGIPKDTRKLYDTRLEYDESTGKPCKVWYPRTSEGKIVNWKYRDIEHKKFGKIASGTGETDLFGMRSIKGTPRIVLITEGEEDAMSAHEMLKGRVHNIACLSLPDGTGSLKSIRDNLEWLSKCTEVYLCPDNDKPGQEVIQPMAELLPDLKIVKDLTEKDANAMLLAGKAADFVNSYMRARKYCPPFLVTVSEVIPEAIKKPVWGRKWPWPTLDRATFGMRDGEGMYLGAGVKIGKSEFINELILSRIQSGDGDVPAVIKFEEQPSMTVRKLAGKMDKTFYHRPDIPFDPKDLEATARSLEGKFLMYRAFGSADWETIRYFIRHCVAEGSKTIIIDPVTRLTNTMTSSDTETALRRFSDELSCMAQDLGFFYVVTCHLKAPGIGPGHERGGKVMSNQFRGSRAMMESCYYMLGIERNKDPALTLEEQNTSTFVLLENRAFGMSKEFKVHYDPDTGDYLEKAVVVPHLGKSK